MASEKIPLPEIAASLHCHLTRVNFVLKQYVKTGLLGVLRLLSKAEKKYPTKIITTELTEKIDSVRRRRGMHAGQIGFWRKGPLKQVLWRIFRWAPYGQW
jgi:hypothetical protein